MAWPSVNIRKSKDTNSTLMLKKAQNPRTEIERIRYTVYVCEFFSVLTTMVDEKMK